MKIASTGSIVDAKLAAILFTGKIEYLFERSFQDKYDAIELHLGDPEEINIDTVLNLSGKYSLPVVAIGTGVAARKFGLSFTDINADVRNASVEYIKKFILLAAKLDAKVIIGSFNGNIGQGQDAELRRSFHYECLRQCCDFANKHSVTIVIESLNRYENDWLNTSSDVLKLIDRVKCDNLRYLADTFHMNIEERDICESLIRAAGKIGHVHFADSNRRYPGKGHIDFAGIVRTLSAIGYNGNISLECIPGSDFNISSIELSGYVHELVFDSYLNH